VLQVASWRLTHDGNIRSFLRPRLNGLAQRVASCGILSESSITCVDRVVSRFSASISKLKSHAQNAKGLLPELLQDLYVEIHEALDRTVQGVGLDPTVLDAITGSVRAAASPADCLAALQPLLDTPIPIVQQQHESWGSVVEEEQVKPCCLCSSKISCTYTNHISNRHRF
jgi:hypothetical protein